MGTRVDRTASGMNRFLGRLFFRTLGTLCVIAALGAAWLGWQAWSDWKPDASPVGLVLSGVFVLLAGWTARYCFSSRRTLIEALDAMEGTAGDLRRRDGELQGRE